MIVLLIIQLRLQKKTGVLFFNNMVNSGGPNKGRNLGIKNATGDYIAFLDQDDEWLEGKIELQLSIDADVVYSQYLGAENKPSKKFVSNAFKKETRILDGLI